MELLKNFSKNINKEKIQISKLNNEITDIKRNYFSNKNDSLGKLLRDEDQVTGKVSYKLYFEFFKIFGGIFFFILLLFLTLGISALSVYGKLFLTDWTEKAEKEKKNKKRRKL